ncbi:MAG: hypothetical protein IJ626_04420 [Muribaculaceae bacterium]|nr:hypothetical protein [Muribaculaceae bacterium]
MENLNQTHDNHDNNTSQQPRQAEPVMPDIRPIQPEQPAKKNFFMRNPAGSFGFLAVIVGLFLIFGFIDVNSTEYPFVQTLWWIGLALLFGGLVACGVGLTTKPRLFAGLGCSFGVLLASLIGLFMFTCARPHAPHLDEINEINEIVSDTTWEYDDSLGRYIPIVSDGLDEVVPDEEVPAE